MSPPIGPSAGAAPFLRTARFPMCWVPVGSRSKRQFFGGGFLASGRAHPNSHLGVFGPGPLRESFSRFAPSALEHTMPSYSEDHSPQFVVLDGFFRQPPPLPGRPPSQGDIAHFRHPCVPRPLWHKRAQDDPPGRPEQAHTEASRVRETVRAERETRGETRARYPTGARETRRCSTPTAASTSSP